MWKYAVPLFVGLVLLSCVQSQTAPSGSYPPPPVRFDFIVVGGGAGGSVISGRLAKQNYSVLVVDAGDRSQATVGGHDYVAARYSFGPDGNVIHRHPLTRYDVPAFAASTQSGDTPNSPTPGFPFNSPQGIIEEHSRILGGNSVHNNMQWNRQSIYSINSWNVTGWSYNDLLPYFKRTENVSATHLAGDPIHGMSGPIIVTEAQALDRSGPAFIQSCINAGYGYTNDFSGTQPIGCGRPLFNIDTRGVRSSALKEYLAPELHQHKLSLTVNAWVSKIIFNTATPPKAIGVQYVPQNPHDGTYNDSNPITVYANKEVILSAGAVNSPKLLLLSGVGPAAHLRSKGIPVIVNSPIGKRQGIHPIVFHNFKYMSNYSNPNAISYPAIEYAINGTGLFASVGFPVQNLFKSNQSLPDYDIFQVGDVASSTPGIFSLITLLVSPTQRNGETLLQSSYYRDAPYFNYTLLQEDADVTALARSIQIARDIVSHNPVASLFGAEVTPGPQYATLAQLKAYIKSGGGVFSITHLFGGCQIGNPTDPLAPLDNFARVKGVNGLRVCDLSVVPGAFNGSPVTNIVAWCEKVADSIISDNSA